MLLAALALAGLGTAAVLSYVSGAESRAMAGKKAVTVLVAAERIPAGTTGERVRSGGYTEAVRMPAETVPADALGALDASLDTLRVTAEIQPRQLLLRGAFAEPSPPDDFRVGPLLEELFARTAPQSISLMPGNDTQPKEMLDRRLGVD